jgi:hypothetical protein
MERLHIQQAILYTRLVSEEYYRVSRCVDFQTLSNYETPQEPSHAVCMSLSLIRKLTESLIICRHLDLSMYKFSGDTSFPCYDTKGTAWSVVVFELTDERLLEQNSLKRGKRKGLSPEPRDA